ncbi:methyl-accepting chemotaxis protein [Paenibacillus campi]|uniref:methyl-accepting chemotaxis protein n=1 Tax=Paenibacillus campi TaxID=3106031 RepID=UPI002AFFF3DF|nr:methyl-accepting chemotaxis protein [Paenibacillus sp. SGZ-1014]
MVRFFKNHLVIRIVAMVTLVMMVVAAGSLLLQWMNMKLAAEESISSYNVQIAESYVKQIDKANYIQFAQNPQQNANFMAIRDELDQFRQRIGAMYVYFVKIDAKGTPLMIVDGMKDPHKASAINEVTDIPPAAVQRLLAGQSASSSIINNKEYGRYISSYAPILDTNGKLLGVIGIDTSVAVIDHVKANVLKSSWIFYLLLFILTVIGIATVMFVIIRALRPLHTLKSSVLQMADGQLAEAHRLLSTRTVRNEDEIGSTYNAMLHMSGNLHEMVRDMVTGVSSTTSILTQSAVQFKQDADGMQQMSTTVNQAMDKIRHGAHTQKQGVIDSSNAMEEIARGINDISESSATVSDAATDALQTAKTGQQSITHVKHQMDHISQAADQVSVMVSTLNNYSQQIGSALHTVTDFAAQTKLLALNASIEAAHAGEHGKGFAVVADEVRKLAEASNQSVQMISTLLLGIQQGAIGIGTQMDQTANEIKQGVTITAAAERAFTEVIAAFVTVSDRIQEISAAAEQITAGTEEAAASVQTIARVSSDVSDYADEIYELVHEQASLFHKITDRSAELSQQTDAMSEAVQRVHV